MCELRGATEDAESSVATAYTAVPIVDARKSSSRDDGRKWGAYAEFGPAADAVAAESTDHSAGASSGSKSNASTGASSATNPTPSSRNANASVSLLRSLLYQLTLAQAEWLAARL